MNANVVQQEFDAKAGIYESYRLADWYKAHAQEIAKLCPQNIDGDILDIGCATGYQLRLLAETNPNSNLVGIDLAPLMIEQAKKCSFSEKRFHFLAADWEDLTDQDQHWLQQFNFKLIVCANTMHYFLNLEKTLENMHNMLADEGIVIILEREKSDSLLTLMWGFLHRHFIKDQVEFYSAQDITELLGKVGFSNSRVTSIIKKYFWKGKLFTSIAIIKGTKT